MKEEEFDIRYNRLCKHIYDTVKELSEKLTNYQELAEQQNVQISVLKSTISRFQNLGTLEAKVKAILLDQRELRLKISDLASLEKKPLSHEPTFKEILSLEAQKVESDLKNLQNEIVQIQNKTGLGDISFQEQLQKNVEILSAEHNEFQKNIHKLLTLLRQDSKTQKRSILNFESLLDAQESKQQTLEDKMKSVTFQIQQNEDLETEILHLIENIDQKEKDLSNRLSKFDSQNIEQRLFNLEQGVMRNFQIGSGVQNGIRSIQGSSYGAGGRGGRISSRDMVKQLNLMQKSKAQNTNNSNPTSSFSQSNPSQSPLQYNQKSQLSRQNKPENLNKKKVSFLEEQDQYSPLSNEGRNGKTFLGGIAYELDTLI